MQSFFEFIAKYKNFITFIALIVICFSLISLGNVNKIGGFRTVIIGTIGWFQSVTSWIPNPNAIRNENRALRELNYQLSSEVTKMREAMAENKVLREIINFQPKIEHDYEIVEVIGRTSIQMRNYLSVNKGKNSGIYDGMPVRTDAGLVGVIIGSTPNYSLVEMIQNRDIKISAKDLRSGYTGIVVWEGGDKFILKNAPKSYDIKSGDMIVTSNFSNKYPDRIPIGVVTKSREEKGELFLKIEIQPYVNFSTIEEAFVLKYIPNTERFDLIKEIDEKLFLRQMEPKKNDKIIFKKDKINKKQTPVKK